MDYTVHCLFTLGKLCDNNCIVILEKNEMNILKDRKLILKGHIEKTDGFWDIPISRPLRNQAHVIITGDRNRKELIQYLHGLCFSSTPRNFLKAMKNGNFLIWIGLKNQQLLKHIPPSIATAL